jgi:RNA-binding protein 39
MKAGERELHRYFRKSAGCKVNDVQLLRDKRTGRHKGCAYVELGRVEDVPRAVAVSGKIPEFQRFPILVKGSEAEKNYGVDGAPVVEVPYSGLTKRVEAQKVYVGSIDCNVTQAQLYAIFSQFGNLEKVVLQVHPNSGMSKGFAFLSFKDPKVANLAIQAMSGQVLAGRPL